MDQKFDKTQGKRTKCVAAQKTGDQAAEICRFPQTKALNEPVRKHDRAKGGKQPIRRADKPKQEKCRKLPRKDACAARADRELPSVPEKAPLGHLMAAGEASKLHCPAAET